jgi:hypothetical protein
MKTDELLAWQNLRAALINMAEVANYESHPPNGRTIRGDPVDTGA